MQGFEWAKAQLGVRTPYDLESKGVTVFFAPHIQDDLKVVDLADGRVVRYPTGEPRPRSGYFADYETLVDFCSASGASVAEADGSLRLIPAASR